MKLDYFFKKHWLAIVVLILTGLLFAQSLNNYFGGDDWFHLNVSQIKNFSEFLNFFNPLPNPQMTAFYRPLPNQFFFFINQSLFGLRPFFLSLADLLNVFRYNLSFLPIIKKIKIGAKRN